MGYHKGKYACLTQTVEEQITQAPTLIGDPYRLVTGTNHIVYENQWQAKTKMMVVHLDQTAPYQGIAWDKWP
jgi:hypothetical protein